LGSKIFWEVLAAAQLVASQEGRNFVLESYASCTYGGNSGAFITFY
jgi:hypothetical protein